MAAETPEIPGPTKGEKQATAAQAELLGLQNRALQQQSIESRILQPAFFDELGFTPQYKDIDPQISGAQLKTILGKSSKKQGIDPSALYTLDEALGMTGEDNTKVRDKITQRFETINPTRQLTALTRKPPTEADTSRQQIEKLALDRELAALRGELPVNPALLSDLAKQERVLEENLAKQLGSGWATSTPGQEGMRSFLQMKNATLENARRADLTLADALQSGALGNRMGQQGQFFGLSGSTTQMPFANIGGYAAAAQGYGQMAQAAAQNRLAQMGIGSANAGGGMSGGLGSMAGMFGGMFSGGGGGGGGGNPFASMFGGGGGGAMGMGGGATASSIPSGLGGWGFG